MEQLDLFNQTPTITADRYHNTIPISGPELKAREMRTEAQGRKILNYFRDHPYERFTPYDILRAFALPERLIVSVRRSITNLTQCQEHYLIMTGDKKREVCGDFNNMWALNHLADQNLFTMTL